MPDKAVRKYLSRYTEAEARLRADATTAYGRRATPEVPFTFVLVIPAYRESPALLTRLQTLFTQTPGVLVVLVINRPDQQALDLRLPTALQRHYPATSRQQNLSWHPTHNGGCILQVDRYSEGLALPPEQGVGLARKIGGDIACELITRQHIDSRWIFTSDADVIWPPGYFEASTRTPIASALIYPFAHQPQRELPALATQLYEFSLHYYVLGLRWAGSPYAFHTLGSTLAIDYQHYARVRGFPKRAAGEDFYLLNKLAKSGPVLSLNNPRLTIVDRQSCRTPFGTGAARERICELDQPADQHPFYHPECFAQLRHWLRFLTVLGMEPGRSIDLWQRRCSESPAPWLETLATMGVARAIAHAHCHSSDSGGFLRHMTQWFDAFRTLKFIHRLRDQYYPSTSLVALVNDAEEPAILTDLQQPFPPTSAALQTRWLMNSNQVLMDNLTDTTVHTSTAHAPSFPPGKKNRRSHAPIC